MPDSTPDPLLESPAASTDPAAVPTATLPTTAMPPGVLPLLPTPPAVPPPRPRRRITFGEDFRRFFLSGLAALMPTLITLWLLLKIWNFLWEDVGQYVVAALKRLSVSLAASGAVPHGTVTHVQSVWDSLPEWAVHLVGVLLAVVLFYIVGFFVGNFLGRVTWRLAEMALIRAPLIRSIYPAVKQVTDFILAEKKHQFESGRVVAVEPHAKGIWSIALVTGGGIPALSRATGQEMITVFVPSSPTAFSGYVMMVPRSSAIELPLTVEQAMRLLVSGGVIDPATLVQPQQPAKLGSLFREAAEGARAAGRVPS